MEEHLADACSLQEMQITEPDSEETDVYHPLNKDTREIRLAHVLPTQHEDIHVELHVASLDSSPEYEALSYVWGHPGITKPIIINGRQMSATVSLEAAFRKFRQQAENAVVIIWADAICINQKDLQEREQQVSIIADIYRNAKRVRAWLGELPCAAANAFQRLIKASIARPRGNSPPEMVPWTEIQADIVLQEAQALLIPGETLAEFARALKPIEENSYWRRKWIIQEAALARSIRLYMGDEWVDLSDIGGIQRVERWTKPWSFLGDIGNALAHKRTSSASSTMVHTAGSDSDDTEDAFHDMCRCLTSIANRSLNVTVGNALEPEVKVASDLHFITSARDTQCSDPRDCVFAIRGLLCMQDAIVPDYRATVSEVFRRFTLSIIHESRCLTILDDACSGTESLPSWVPDFTQPGLGLIMGQTNASAISSIVNPIFQSGPGRLQVPTLVIDRIVALPSAYDPIGLAGGRVTLDMVLDLYNTWNAIYSAIVSLTEQFELADVDQFWQTLEWGTAESKDRVPLDVKDLRQKWKSFQEGRCESIDDYYHPVYLLTEFIARNDMFFTRSSNIGGVQKFQNGSLRSGDYIIIIASATMPFCARLEHNRGDEAFRLLRPCFIPGRR